MLENKSIQKYSYNGKNCIECRGIDLTSHFNHKLFQSIARVKLLLQLLPKQTMSEMRSALTFTREHQNRKTKEPSLNLRRALIDCHKAGKSISKIFVLLGVSRSIVHSDINKLPKFSNVRILPNRTKAKTIGKNKFKSVPWSQISYRLDSEGLIVRKCSIQSCQN